jgi:hypothetical protein
MPKRPRTEAICRAQKAYNERIKGTEMGERVKKSQRESSRRAFNRKYALDSEFRQTKINRALVHYYYKTAENDGVLKSVKHLFGNLLFYGR